MINIDEFRNYLKIDKGALDDELIQQSTLFFQVSEAYVEAAAIRDGFKESLTSVDAELDGQIRQKSDKITEAQVKGKIQLDPKHMIAFDKYLDAKQQADQLSALKEAFAQRGYMLRDLCQLYTTGYFESSSVKSTTNTDAVAYKQRRERLAVARQARDSRSG